LRAIDAAGAGLIGEPEWMGPFLASLARDDLAPATLRGYRYDLRHFLAWHRTVQDIDLALEDLAEYELIAYRQHMVAGGRRPATVNRRLDALRRLCRWARGTGALAADVARDVRPMRTARNHQPAGLTDVEVHALLRAAGASSHGLAARNYAMVQLMLQAGLRVGEVAALQASDIIMNDRSGSVRIRHGTIAPPRPPRTRRCSDTAADDDGRHAWMRYIAAVDSLPRTRRLIKAVCWAKA